MLPRDGRKRADFFATERRTTPRTDCYVRLPVIFPDLLQHVAPITNISPDGALMLYATTYDIGARVSIKFPIIGVTHGIITWCKNGQIGVEFDFAIAAQDYLPVLKAIGVTPQ